MCVCLTCQSSFNTELKKRKKFPGSIYDFFLFFFFIVLPFDHHHWWSMEMKKKNYSDDGVIIHTHKHSPKGQLFVILVFNILHQNEWIRKKNWLTDLMMRWEYRDFEKKILKMNGNHLQHRPQHFFFVLFCIHTKMLNFYNNDI